jgi:hypothetical protein
MRMTRKRVLPPPDYPSTLTHSPNTLLPDPLRPDPARPGPAQSGLPDSWTPRLPDCTLHADESFRTVRMASGQSWTVEKGHI